MRAKQFWQFVTLGVVFGLSTSAWGTVIVDSQQVFDESNGTSDGTTNTFTSVPLASSSDFLEGAQANASGTSLGPNANGASISASQADADGFGVPLSVVTDGQIATSPDDPSHGVYFGDSGAYTITINLGTPISIDQFNTYSRHTSDRLLQHYTLIGSNDPSFANATTIATVNAGAGGGGELGVSIHDDSQIGLSPDGTPIGTFQYLQMQIDNDSGGTGGGDGTFYAEIDVVVPEPASLSLLALSACGLLARRRRA